MKEESMTDRMKNGECCPYNGHRGLHSPWCKGSALASQAKQAGPTGVLNALEVLERMDYRPGDRVMVENFLRVLGERGMWVISNPLPAPIEQITPENTDGVQEVPRG